jgi:hypothetical protein
MNDTFRSICLALIVGIVAGACAATYVRGVDAQGKIRLEFYDENSGRHLELGHLDSPSGAGRVPRFWGMKVRNGDAFTAIGIYTDRPAVSAKRITPALDNFGLPPRFEWPDKYAPKTPN